MPYEQWSKNNASLVLDGVADAIVTIDARGAILYVNKAVELLFGFAARELLGRPVDVLMPSEIAERHQGYVADYVESGVAKIIGKPRELMAQKKSGEQFAILLTVNELHSDGAPHFSGIIRDLTEQNERQVSLHAQREQLSRAGRLTTAGEMTASIAHEMNQPLTAVAMYAEACQRMLAAPEVDVAKLSAALKKLCDQALRAGAVNQRVQQFVRSDTVPRELLDMNQLLEDIRPLAASDGRAHGIELVYDLGHQLPRVACVGLNVQQVVLSLLRNAFDAMADIHCANGSRVLVESELVSTSEGERLQVAEVDEGPGIRDDIADSLFEAFVTSKKQGIGLGLSTCRSLIKEEGGELAYRNREQSGAVFYFRLPVAGADGAGNE